MIQLKISTHGGNEYEAVVEEYNPAELNQELNNHEINTVCIGDIILSRIDVKAVVPVKVEIEEIPEEIIEEQTDGITE